MSKCKVMAIANQKGGVGKTSTAFALAYGLASQGRRVLAIDADAQGNLSFAVGVQSGGPSIFGVLTQEAQLAQAIVTATAFDVVPSSKNISQADAALAGVIGRDHRLREGLETVRDNYDFVIIDCPPQLGAVTVNSLTAADFVIVPCQADAFSLQGISDLFATIGSVRKYSNPTLAVLGILVTKYSPRTNLGKDLKETLSEMAAKLETRLFKSTIRDGVSLRECQLLQQSLFDYAPTSGVAMDYKAFIDEVVEGVK